MGKPRLPQRGLTDDNVGEPAGCRISETIRRFLCAGCRVVPISVLPAIVANVIALVDARAGLGLDRSASLIGVTKAVSEAPENTSTERGGGIASDPGA